MKGYFSVGHATANEDGDEQVELEYRNGICRKIYLMFKGRTLTVPDFQKEVWVLRKCRWVGKHDGKIANYEKNLELGDIVDYLDRLRNTD